MQFTVEKVKELLKIYNYIPHMIAEEFATIRNCENEKNKITLSSINLSDMPGSKGIHVDRTASMALAYQTRYYEDEIESCYRRISELREYKNCLHIALKQLNQIDRYILELAYMGDSKKQRRYDRRPPWKEIASKVNYSESQTRARATAAILILSDLLEQQAFSDMMQ